MSETPSKQNAATRKNARSRYYLACSPLAVDSASQDDNGDAHVLSVGQAGATERTMKPAT